MTFREFFKSIGELWSSEETRVGCWAMLAMIVLPLVAVALLWDTIVDLPREGIILAVTAAYFVVVGRRKVVDARLLDLVAAACAAYAVSTLL